tara:strand:+ start:1078 stop:2514 length:1437 start_codon:yes stop_codon:yes gene_type:complete
MSTPSFKNLTQDDFTATRTMLNERIPLTGTLISGSARYGVNASDNRALNIKSFAHNMFQSVYDYPYLSSSANHIFDITAGFSANTGQSVSSSANTDVAKKVNVYNQMAQVLVGYDVSGNVRRFDPDGNFSNNSVKLENAVFLNFSRLLVKDEIKKGSFRLSLGTNQQYTTPFATKVTLSDVDSAENYRNNSPAGEYGFLKTQGQAASVTFNFTNSPTVGRACTIIALQADGTTTTSATFTVTGNAGTTDADEFSRGGDGNGAANFVTAIQASPIANLVTVTRDGNVVTITQVTAGANGNTTIGAAGSGALDNVTISGGGKFTNGVTAGTTTGLIYYQAGIAVMTGSLFGDNTHMNPATNTMSDLLIGSTISSLADGVRHRIDNITFDNVTELNSSIYFCRINHNDFNYSSNPTYLKDSKIVVKTNPSVANEANLSPITYITTVGLYSTNNELMAVAKLSEPLKKTPDNEFTLRVRLDY